MTGPKLRDLGAESADIAYRDGLDDAGRLAPAALLRRMKDATARYGDDAKFYRAGVRAGRAARAKKTVARVRSKGKDLASTRLGAEAATQVSGLAGSLVTFVGIGLAIVMLWWLITNGTTIAGFLGAARGAVNWLVSPTAGIWHG